MNQLLKFFKSMKSASKIIALDFQNAKLENVENWFISSNISLDENIKYYIRNTVAIWNDYENPIQRLFMINNVHFAQIQKGTSSNVEISDIFKEEIIRHLVPIKLNEIEAYRSLIIDWIFNTHKTKPKTALELSVCQKYKEEDRIIFPGFIKSVTAIDVEELGFTLKEFFVPLNMKFKNIYSETKKHNSKSTLNKIKLTKIFVVDKFILGYTFRNEKEEVEHFFWNIHLDDLFSLIEPIKFDDEIPLTLNAILDKINLVGIQNLEQKEQYFLNNL